ncbi:MAG: hypothetical protein SAK29_22225 [Scytonema sp. PMC 1069.18]|nr:hypothetical protein [Scytonema sp. PMC 1069.18]MEC4883066.1 hypothetical protein [Scytonema sp. PMC 1070.18]
MNDSIGDRSAIAFSVGFYKALAANRSIEDAYKFGCVEIQLNNFSEHLKPILYIKDANQEPERVLDLQKPDPNPNIAFEETSPFIIGSSITHPRHFFGREKELKRLFNLLKRHPLQNAAIIGKRRIGKTSILHYLFVRFTVD